MPRPKPGPVLAVGSRAGVIRALGDLHDVALTDRDGKRPITTIAEGAEVEIVAWLPQRSGGTRYRVRPMGGGVEGWLGNANLKSRQPPPAPKPPAAAAPTPAPAKRKPRVTSPRSRKAPFGA